MATKNRNRNYVVPYTPDLEAAWVGFDLDGTLAFHAPGSNILSIGEPIQPILNILKGCLDSGLRCKIFTARADRQVQVIMIQNWLQSIGVPPLEVTNVKDYKMLYFYDDRARQVLSNRGIVVGD